MSQQEITRILDANFNRAREALRVMEDFARFALDERALCEQLKQLRHDLTTCIADLPLDLLGGRDTSGDIGTEISTAQESLRSTTEDVIEAAAGRLTEALRCLEEYSKIVSPSAAEILESLRYRAYEAHKQLLLRPTARHKRLAQVRLYVLLTESRCHLPWREVLQQVLEAGVGCVQLREKELCDAELLERAQEVREKCQEFGVLFIMNDRSDIAVLSQCDGIHLGQDDLAPEAARRLLNPRQVIGVSTHNESEFCAAASQEPDYLAVGSVFASPTKPEVPACGLEYIRLVREGTTGTGGWMGPLFAIGGIAPENAGSVFEAGATGIAVCDAVIAREEPGRGVECFLDAMVT